MTQKDSLGGLRQGIASVGAFAKPLDMLTPGLGTGVQTLSQLIAMSIPTQINYTPINPYNTNPMGVVGFRNLGGTLDPNPKEKKKALHNNIIQSINQGAAQGLSYDQIIQSIDPLLLQKDAVLESMIRPSFDSSNIPNESVKALYPGRFFNLGGNIPGIGMYLNGGNLDQQITKDSFKVQGNSGIDTNFRNVEGQQALLTKNEVVSKLNDGSNYVFSDHIKNPLTGNSLAKDAEKLKKRQKQAEDRAASGDLISKKTVGKIKEQVEELSTINDMALEVIKETMGEQADAFLCGGKMKTKKYVLGGASELPQDPEPVSLLPFPLMYNMSTSQVPVITGKRIPRATELATQEMLPTRATRGILEPLFQVDPQGTMSTLYRIGMENRLKGGITDPNLLHRPDERGLPSFSLATPPTPLQDPMFRDQPFLPTRTSPVMTTPSPYNPAYVASQMGPQPLATETPTGSIPTVTEEQLKQATGSSSGSGKGKGRSRSSNYVPGTEELKYGKPSDWKGYTTKEFQDFVRKQDPKALSKFGADGKWGSETEAAWNKFGKAFLTSKGDFGVSGSPSIATIPPYLINQKNPDLKGPDTEKKDKESGDNFANFQKYIGDVMQGLAFAGQLGNLGTVEWENIPKMDLRQIDPAIYQEQLRAARNAQMQNVAGSYSTNQAGQQAAYSQYLNQLTQTLQQVDTTNKQLATETQSYNNQADVQQQIARMQALAAHDAAKQNIWGSFANAGMAINQQYSNQVGQAALASAYPLVYEGLMKDMQEFLSTNNKKKTKTSE